MKYKVGEVANLFGLTTTAIRFYETEGVIETKKEENGHRYYELEDLVKLINCKETRNREIPLKEITSGLRNKAYNNRMFIGNHMRNKLMLQEKIDLYKRLVDDLDEYIEQLCRMESMVGTYEIVECEATWFNGSPDGTFLDKKGINNEILKLWMDQLPFTKLGALFEFTEKNPKKAKATLGLLAPETKAINMKLPKGENVVQIEKTYCLHTVVICKSLFKNEDISLENVVDYMHKKKLKPAGTIFGTVLFHDNDEIDWKSYVDLWIPIQ